MGKLKTEKHTTKTAPKVHAIWVDSSTLHGWGQDADDDFVPVLCETVGFLVKSERSYIALALNKGPTKFGDVISIPMECVRSIERLK